MRIEDLGTVKSPDPHRRIPLRRSYCEKEIPAFPIHEKKNRTIRGAADGGTKLVDRLHRLAVHLLDDVARLNARVGRAAIRIDLLHDQAVGITRQTSARAARVLAR